MRYLFLFVFICSGSFLNADNELCQAALLHKVEESSVNNTQYYFDVRNTKDKYYVRYIEKIKNVNASESLIEVLKTIEGFEVVNSNIYPSNNLSNINTYSVETSYGNIVSTGCTEEKLSIISWLIEEFILGG